MIDTAAGISTRCGNFSKPASIVLVITTPEPTAIADAYAMIKSLSGSGVPRLKSWSTNATSAEQATLIAERIRETARTFLHVEVAPAGFDPQRP